MANWRSLLLLAALLLQGACQTLPENSGLRLYELETHPKVISFSLDDRVGGQLIVPVILPNDRTVHLLLDTGATRSALYSREWNRLGTKAEETEIVRIHGMIEAGLQPVASVPFLQIGESLIQDIKFARLSEPGTQSRAGETPHDGLLGMDILSNFHIYVDGPKRKINFIPIELGAIVPPISWEKVQLKPNPFIEDARNLHFLDMRLGNQLTAALFDTGSEFNLMNWKTADYPQIRNLKKKLRNDWEIAGAIGEFKPLAKIKVLGYRAGQKMFDPSNFLLMEFDSLEVLGIEQDAFIVLGSRALKDERYIIDFVNDQVAFHPGKKSFDEITSGGSAIQTIQPSQ